MAINSPEYFQAQCSQRESSWNGSERTSIIQNFTSGFNEMSELRLHAADHSANQQSVLSRFSIAGRVVQGEKKLRKNEFLLFQNIIRVQCKKGENAGNMPHSIPLTIKVYYSGSENLFHPEYYLGSV